MTTDDKIARIGELSTRIHKNYAENLEMSAERLKLVHELYTNRNQDGRSWALIAKTMGVSVRRVRQMLDQHEERIAEKAAKAAEEEGK